jgi:pantetheine-phosphate adenylyltransferase
MTAGYKRALFPGSFDPPSLGHVDIIRRGARLYDELIVGLAVNPEKQSCFSVAEKQEMLGLILSDLPNVRVEAFEGLVVNFAQGRDCSQLLRGLRAFSDFEYEFRMALANRKLSGIETTFLMADPKLSHISSTLIRDIARYDAALSEFVPESIQELIREKFAVSPS